MDMELVTKKLRQYQVRLVTDVCRTTGDVLVDQPTGSGKTVQIVTLVAMHLGRRFSHALISAPQEQIEAGFVKRDYQEIAFPDCHGVAVPSIQVPKALIIGARESRLGSVKRVIHYLRQAGPLDHAFACTHAALNRLTPNDLPDDLSRKALFIDEAHHASADGLAQLVTLWRERGGQLFFFTATPYRGDGRPVRLEGMKAYRRSLAEHMAEGFAPRHLESEIVALGHPGDVITGGQFSGEEALPKSYDEPTVAAICRRWLEDGKPKAIVRVPPMRGGRSGALVSQLMQALALHGARLLDATGIGAADKHRFLTGLEAERNRTFANSKFDVMVGIQRVLEGTDWPVCSAVYCVGMPGSLNTVVQFLGRAMRLKSADYPAEQRDRARLVFFVPCGGGAALADLAIDHSRHALLTCCFLADHEVGQEWIVLREVRRGIESALGSRADNPAAADAENEADEALDPEVRAEVEMAIASAREQIVSTDGEPTLGEVMELTAKTRPDLRETALQRVAAEILASLPGAKGEKARKAIRRNVATKLKINPMVKEAMEAAFAIVLDEFRDETLTDSAVLESVGRQVHGVTGGQMREFAQRLKEAVPTPLTEEQILSWADHHFESTGEWPSGRLGPVLAALGETWSGINAALGQGGRGLPGGSSLAVFLAKHRGRRNQKGQPSLTIEQILAWANAYYDETGKWPKRSSGEIKRVPGETWSNINAFLIAGGRGLPGGSSLPKFLAIHCGVRNKSALPFLSKNQVLEWADAHHAREAKWPTPESGPVAESPGETWKAVQMALFNGLRGLSGSSSLIKLLAEHRGVKNIQDLPPLTENQILNWADSHKQKTGDWPTSTSGPVVESPDETWNAIQGALSHGARGLPGRSSLVKLLEKHRGRKNRRNQPHLTVEQILNWADAFFRCTGKWPNARSGLIAETLGQTWSGIEASLQQGTRGLPGGSSLAKLLAQHLGVRNTAMPPSLTLDQILVWADRHFKRTGKWPTTKGPVHGEPGETWSAIDAALRNGRRGLPGGSSLTQVFVEHRGLRDKKSPPPLTIKQILALARSHHQRTGEWPTRASGFADDAKVETWSTIHGALFRGGRGLPGGSSLAQFLDVHLGVRNCKGVPKLTTDSILLWVDAYRLRFGQWPQRKSGAIDGVPEENWKKVDNALRIGLRGLSGGSSLARLCNAQSDKMGHR